MKLMELGGIQIPVHAALDLSVEDSSEIRETIHKMGDGGNAKQVYAGSQEKSSFILSCSGVVPPGLDGPDGLDTTGPLLLKMVAERSTNKSPSNQIALPTNRRSDLGYEPWGRAFVNNEIIPTDVSVADDVATLTPVAGPNPQYQVLWYPKLTVITVGKIKTITDVNNATVAWYLALLEV